MPSNTRRLVAITVMAAGTLAYLTVPAHSASIDTVSATNDVIIDDLNAMSAAGGDADVDAMHDACSDLIDDSGLALTYSRPKAIPRSAWRHMRSTWQAQVDAGVLCEEGTEELDSDKLYQSTAILKQGTAHLNRATAILNAAH